MHLINVIVNYLYRKYGVPLNNFFENWTIGTSHLKHFCLTVISVLVLSDDPDERMSHMVDEMLRCLRPLEFHRMEEFHISLSRTVVIRHHWIQPLTDSLQKKFTNASR